MTISFENVAVGSGLDAAVPPLTLSVTPGEPTVIAVESDERPLLVSMLLGGRMEPDSGSVTIDGHEDADNLRRRTALVDTPFVAEPPAGISLASVVAEEFSFAGRSTSRAAVERFLEQHGLADYAKLAIRALPPLDRVRLFSELALLRQGVDTLIVTSPERHGADPSGWYSTLAGLAERNISVAIVTDFATRDILLGLGARDAATVMVEPAPATAEAVPSKTQEKVKGKAAKKATAKASKSANKSATKKAPKKASKKASSKASKKASSKATKKAAKK